MDIHQRQIEFRIPSIISMNNDEIASSNLIDITDLMQKYGNARPMYVTKQSVSFIEQEAQLSASEARQGMSAFAAVMLNEVVDYASSRAGVVDKHTFFYHTEWEENRPQWSIVSIVWNEIKNQMMMVFGFETDMQLNGFIDTIPDSRSLS